MADRTEATAVESEILEPADGSEFDEILERNGAVLVDFSADWCGPCQMMEETVESVSESTEATVV